MIRTACAIAFMCTVSYAQVSTDSLLSFWTFNESGGTIVHDSSGLNHTGTPHGASWTNGVTGKAILLNDSTEYVQADSTAAYSNFGSALTFSFWLNPSKKGRGGNGNVIGDSIGGLIISKWVRSLEDKRILLDSNLSVDFYLFKSFSLVPLVSNSKLPLNQWTNITATYDGTTARLYINGALDNSMACSGPISNNTGKLYIGNNPDRAYMGTFGVCGSIDNVRIYSRALSASEAATIYTGDLLEFGNLDAAIYNLTTSAAISGATVTMTFGGSRSQATGGNGVAAFSSIPAGNYVFSVTAPGYTPDTGLAATIIAGETTYISWYLKPLPPPSAPALMAPANGAPNISTSPTFLWNSVANASSYRVQASLSSSFAIVVYDQSGLSATQATISGLPNSTTVYWHVNAANSAGASVWSPSWSFTTIPAPPSAPNLISPANGATGISLTPVLSWGVTNGASWYEVQISPYVNFSTIISDMSGLVAPSTTGSGLSYGTVYYWRADASNAGGTGGWSSVWSFTTMPLPPPNVPSLVSPLNGANNISTAPSLGWNAVANASSYRLQASLSSVFASVDFDQSGLSATQATISGLPNSTTVYWHVNAANSTGTSVWSPAWSFTTIPGPPSAPNLVSPFNSTTGISLTPVLSWGVTNGASSYEVQISSVANFSTIISDVSGLAATSTTGSGLYYGTVYYWRADASNAGGTGGWSGIWSFTTMPLPAPGVPNLVSPMNGALSNTSAPSLAWSTSTDAASYQLQASFSTTFSPVIFDLSGIPGTSMLVSGIPPGAMVYWHVDAANISGTSIWSNTWSFTVSPSAVLTQRDVAYSKGISFSVSGITYALPAASSVSIALYDMQGRQVRQLVNATQNAGFYRINFDRARVTAGSYIVEFKTGSFIVRKKLALLH